MEDVAAEQLLSGALQAGDTALVDGAENGLRLYAQPAGTQALNHKGERTMKLQRTLPLLLLLALLLAGCQGEAAPAVSYDLDQVPAYAGEPYRGSSMTTSPSLGRRNIHRGL